MHKKTKQSEQADHTGIFDQWIDVFRTGTLTDSAGVTRTFKTSDLDSIVANHSSDETAPAVVGHPKDDSPAYGWTQQLRRVGNKLQAKFRQVNPDFAEAVEKGRYKKRSVRIEPTDGGKGWKLLHVGWLGGMPPAVDGLQSAFSSGQPETYVDFEIADSFTPMITGGFLQRLREWLLDRFDQGTADRVVPSHEIDALNEHTRRQRQRNIEDTPPDNSFNTPDDNGGSTVTDETKALQQRLDAAEARNKELEGQVASSRLATRRQDFAAVVRQAVAEFKLSPAQASGLADFMAHLPHEQDSAIEFAAGDSSTRKATMAEYFSEFLKGLPVQESLQALAEEKAGKGDDETPASFNAPPGAMVDNDRAELHQRAVDYQRQHKCTWIEAVQAVEAK